MTNSRNVKEPVAKHKKQSPPIQCADAPAWHAFDVKAVIENLQTDPHAGLSTAEATRRLEQYGPNTLKTVGKVPWYVVFARQFLSGLIIILVVAAAIALVIGEVTDAITIMAIVVFNGVLGFVQEWKVGTRHRGPATHVVPALYGVA